MNRLAVRNASEKRVIQIVDASAQLTASDNFANRPGARKLGSTGSSGSSGSGTKRAFDPTTPAEAASGTLAEATLEFAAKRSANAAAAGVSLSAATQARITALKKVTRGIMADNEAGKAVLQSLKREVEDVSVDKMNKFEKRDYDARRWEEVVGRKPPQQKHHRRVAQGILGKKHERAVAKYEETKARGLQMANPNVVRRHMRHQEERRRDSRLSHGSHVDRIGLGRKAGDGGIVLSKREIKEGGRQWKEKETVLHKALASNPRNRR